MSSEESSRSVPLPESNEERTFTVRVEPLGRTFDAPESLTVLEAAGFANLHLPRMCRNGTCRTCLCRLVSGSVRYTIEWPGVSAEEKAQGYILPCVAVAQSDLVLDAPDAAELPPAPTTPPVRRF
ncbi:2Fe-2S iron-sulfur cluster-binding protein [Paraburkholderia caribensis]|uniref:2Fe-2S iron-sulfur cluster-binding protein n=1 Tax=Paraburkholderia TaxID=1822464 RepID=UPI001CB5C775|nr:2Fe-2S iron-sulfur cluster-binding protein [Paraburkholderia caribensis]BEU24851.1 2Fe-2S iron-sulfur cluster-binding protein [Paraburkholderia sp. 22B1P]GJH33016.1 2Fe-2S iron-sulfur cluster binding domain-containing protein [Paraburkholderia hospita]CAG9267897.1 Ferredoxin [Paraburkholderia caribensis]